MSTVNVVRVKAHPTTGAIITQSKNPEWGTIRVDSMTKSFENGILNVSNRTAFIRGKIKDLEALGLKAEEVMAGKIIKQESFTPFYEGQKPKINPSTAEVVLKDGRNVFLNYVYTSDVNAPTDVFITDNVTEEQKVL